MPAPIDLPGVADAAEFLRRLPVTARQRGERYYNDGRVRSVSADPRRPHEFLAVVEGSDEYQVRLVYDREMGWSGICTCPLTANCKHMYAAMKSLLAENSAGRVASLSSGATPATSPKTNLIHDLESALERRLTRDEKKYVTRVRELFHTLRGRRMLWGWELAELGLKMPDGNTWPGMLESERNFWNSLVYYTTSAGGRVPAFMAPITDLASVEAQMAQWKREADVAHWQERINSAAAGDFPSSAIAPLEYHVRARFESHAIHLDWRRPGMADFEVMKPMQARALRDDILRDRVMLAPEALWIWEAFLPELEMNGRTNVSYEDREGVARFIRLFRIPAFQPLLVNHAGEPYQRPSEPLRWDLQPAGNDDDDYMLRLVQADGSPVPPLMLSIGGQPALYVGENAVFRGPPQSDLFAVEKPNLIPARALETKAGAALLLSINVELPPRLRERVKTVPLHLVLVCELSERYMDGSSEQCVVRARAAAPDGSVLDNWDGYSWDNGDSPREKKGGPIVVKDRSRLRDPNSAIGPLGAKWEGYAGTWNLRVTKKFPEQFVSWLQGLPPEVQVELRGELKSLTEHTIAGSLKLDVAEAGIDWFDLRVVLDIADTTLSQEEIKLLLNARGGFVRLKDKGWRRLEFKLSEEEDEHLARLGLNPRELTAEPQRLHALQLADAAAKRFLPEPQFDQISRRAGELKARVTPAIPGDIVAELRPYQEEGFHFLAYLSENRFGGILADDMGLGKTLQTLTWFQWLRVRNGANGKLAPSLVVCPKSVTDNWRSETERFTRGVKVKVWTADEMALFPQQIPEFDLHVINYNQLRMIGETLAPVQWLAVILDEGQYIKNPSSITAQIARSLRAEHRLVLSGTPIENKLMDLWSLMSFAMPGALGSRAQFAKLYDAKEDPFARKRLSARVRPFLLRRTKSQVAKDLPDRIEEDILCEMEGEQKTLYRAELKRAQQMLLRVQTQKQLAKERFHFLTSLLRLRQICCHPRLVKSDSKAPGAKVEALVEQLEPLIEEGQKVLIFSQFVQMLDLLKTEIAGRDWPHFYLAGETENRGDLVAKFQAAEGPAVFLISLKAGGFGLNLTAASYVILFDPWWNPAVENQAIDRTHRIGQKQNVNAYRLLIKGSIEEKIRALQKTKSALADDVLGEEKFAQSLSLEDLQFLLADT